MASPLYAPVADLQEAMDGTDSGTGTASQLNATQLTAALTAASTRISIYAGQVYDSSTPAAVPPDPLHDLCIDLAMFYATTTYLKHKAMGPDHPVVIRYKDAMTLLADVRDGKLRLDPQPGGGITEAGTVINRIPNIFTPDNSNTRVDPVTGFLEPDTTVETFSPSKLAWNNSGDAGGAVYQG